LVHQYTSSSVEQLHQTAVGMTMRMASLGILSAAMLMAAAAAVTAAEPGIQVEMNQAKIVKLARPADTIVIGNPAIADASVQDASTIVLTAKGFGVTNLVVLDNEGNPIVDEQVTVVPRRRWAASSHRPHSETCPDGSWLASGKTHFRFLTNPANRTSTGPD
jgi:Flp pilus assembly secretin CpaC